MFRVAILGCENSHANIFLKFVIQEKKYSDVEFVGVYSDDMEAANKLKEEFGVEVAQNYDDFVGKVDGIIVTARHGDSHYKFAKPYIEAGIPMFIDKPVTVTEEDAVSFKAELIKNNVKVSGGSSLKYPAPLAEMKKIVAEKSMGAVFGGSFRAPVSMKNDHGNFFFYAQHLVQMMCEAMGYFPNSVKAFRNGNVINCTVRYDEYDVNLVFVDGNYKYFASVSCEEGVVSHELTLDGCFEKEFEAFYQTLLGNDQEETYDAFFSPVFILNAINRSLESGNEEVIKRG